jgi:hypothetical protein
MSAAKIFAGDAFSSAAHYINLSLWRQSEFSPPLQSAGQKMKNFCTLFSALSV